MFFASDSMEHISEVHISRVALWLQAKKFLKSTWVSRIEDVTKCLADLKDLSLQQHLVDNPTLYECKEFVSSSSSNEIKTLRSLLQEWERDNSGIGDACLVLEHLDQSVYPCLSSACTDVDHRIEDTTRRMHEIERRISQTHRKYVELCAEWEVDPETPDEHPQQLLQYLHHLHEAVTKVDMAMREDVFGVACNCYWNDDEAAKGRLGVISQLRNQQSSQHVSEVWSSSLTDSDVVNMQYTSDLSNRFVACITSRSLSDDLHELKMFYTARIHCLSTGHDVILTPVSELEKLPALTSQLAHVEGVINTIQDVQVIKCCMMLTRQGYFNRILSSIALEVRREERLTKHKQNCVEQFSKLSETHQLLKTQAHDAKRRILFLKSEIERNLSSLCHRPLTIVGVENA